MDKKFYVTFETAKLLKEKGFNKTVDKLIHLNQYNIPVIESPEKYYDESEVYNDYLYLKQNHYACPTKSEVIDWLEQNEIVIEINSIRNNKWRFSIYKNGRFQIDSWIHDRLDFSTRLEAEEAAIIKALELYERSK